MQGYGLIGKMRSGKDEAASFLINKYGGKNLKFADPLYEMEAEIFRIAQVAIPEDKTKRRRLLQFLGTEWGRETIDPNLWAKVMDSRLIAQKYNSDANRIFITDCRFPDEVEVLRKHDFKIIKIQRPNESRIAAGATNTDHPSETSLDNYTDFDVEVLNNVNNLDSYHSVIDQVYTDIVNGTLKKGMRYVSG